MKRFLILSWAALFLSLNPAFAQEVALRNQTVVEGRYVTLGDLFTNAGANAIKNVAYAPEPGKRAIFGAEWLFRVARAYGLQWRPLNLKTRAIVERASQEIHPDEIEDKIRVALEDRGFRDDFEIDTGGQFQRVFVAAEEAGTVGVASMNVDSRTGRYVATLVVPEDAPAARRIRIAGKIHPVVQVPVLSDRARRGDVINKDDIEWMNVRKRLVRTQTIVESENLVGMAASRTIQPHQPISVNQIRRPLLVPKGSLVTMELKTAFMNLSVQGTAMEEGSKGDVIQIRNTQSKKIVEARVIGPGVVTVGADGPSAIN